MARLRPSLTMPWLAAGAKWAALIAFVIGTRLEWHAAVGGPTGDELLFVLAANGDAAGVKRALEAGARADADDGRSLILAAHGGDAAVVRLLLAHGANPSSEGTHRYTPLKAASIGGHVEVIRLLLDAGADPNQPVMPWQTALGAAACFGHERAVELLLARGARARGDDAEGGDCNPPLVAAAGSGSAPASLLRRLIAAGADVNAADDEETTPLMAAIAAERPDLVELLIRAGAQRRSRKCDRSEQPARAAVPTNTH